MRVKTTLVATALAGLITMLLSGPAAADVIRVQEGDSIQAASTGPIPATPSSSGPGPIRRAFRSRRTGSR